MRLDLRYAMALFVVFALCVVPVSAATSASASRTVSSSVYIGNEFNVTINVADYGAAGQVLEDFTGFTYNGSSLPSDAVTVNGSKVSFLLMGETSFSYTLIAPSSTGTYTLEGILRDIDKNVTNLSDSTITVKKTSSSSGGGGSSSSGGGGGGSSEPASNVEAYELSQKFVTSDHHITFEFPKNVTCIRYVEYDALKSAGKITTRVEMLKGQSELVSSLPDGTVYKNVNIWVGNSGYASSENLENSVVGFKIEKAWMEENGVDEASLNFWFYEDDAWSKLEAESVGEDGTYAFFDVETPGFGSFVVTGPEEKSKSESTESVITPDSPQNKSETTAQEPTKTPDESGIPGFESVLAVGIFGAVCYLMRRKV